MRLSQKADYALRMMVGLSGMAYKLFWVTLGNLLAGSVFMALGYWLYSRAEHPSPVK